MYLKRFIEQEIDLELRTSGAILVSGPNIVGKARPVHFFKKCYRPRYR